MLLWLWQASAFLSCLLTLPSPVPFLSPSQGDFEELVGYEEDCTPASLPEVGGDLFDEQL